MPIKKPLVLGAGGVGALVATLLTELEMKVASTDMVAHSTLPKEVEFIEGDVTDSKFLEKALTGRDAVICCLPFHLTLMVAKAAHAAGIFYFDATEDVASTEMIKFLSANAIKTMVPQNGLAPGFIGIVGAHIANEFDEGTLRHIKLRVGALPQHPIGQLGYAGNWSLEGLVHEYIAECDAIYDGKRQKIPALRNVEILRINGIEYEAFTTSGGLGTMTETYEGKAEIVDYKSIRYPGHLAGMKLLIEELRFKDNPSELVKRLRSALPPDDQDRVLIHASVQGKIGGQLKTKELVTDYKPVKIGGKTRPAIQWTTAASIVAVVEMVSKGLLPQKGFVRQEDISLKSFLKTTTGAYYADNDPVLKLIV